MYSELDQLASAIANRLHPTIPLSIDIWDAKTCAEFLKVTAKYFSEHIAPVPNFPQAIRLPLKSGGRTSPRWKAQEIIDWTGTQQEKRVA